MHPSSISKYAPCDYLIISQTFLQSILNNFAHLFLAIHTGISYRQNTLIHIYLWQYMSHKQKMHIIFWQYMSHRQKTHIYFWQYVHACHIDNTFTHIHTERMLLHSHTYLLTPRTAQCIPYSILNVYIKCLL